MTKSHKSKKAQTADFQKTKIKVGKKKLAPANSTDVSFKSKTLVIPGQSMLEDKGDMTNARNLSLKDLLGQLKHYSPNVRKDALFGLVDLHKRHRTALSGHLTAVLEQILPLSVDDNKPVRAALLALLAALTADVPAVVMTPFMPLFQVYVTAALTHIYEDVRLHALDFVDLWIAAYADSAPFMSRQVVPLYVSMLTNISSADAARGTAAAFGAAAQPGGSAAASGMSGGRLLSAPSSKLSHADSRSRILASMYRFIEVVLQPRRDALWFTLDGSRTTTEARGAWYTEAPLSLGADDAAGPVAGASAVRVATLASYDLQVADEVQAFLAAVLPVLLECWIEHAPTTFQTTEINDLGKLAILSPILRTINLLWRQYSLVVRAADARFVAAWVRDVERHISPFFPFGRGSYLITNPQAKVVLDQMSLEYCELASHLLVCRAPEAFAASLARANDHVVALLQSWPAGAGAETLERLLPLLWRQVMHGERAAAEELLEALQAFYASLSARTPTAKLAARFYVAAITHRRRGTLLLHEAAELQHFWRAFVLTVPRTLWELRATDAAFTSDLLTSLSLVLRTRTSVDGEEGEAASSAIDVRALQAALVPFFFKLVNAKDRPEPLRVFGPFVQLPRKARGDALSLLFYLQPLQSKLLSALLVAVTSGAVDVDTVLFALQIVRLCEATETDGTSLSFYASVLFGASASDTEVAARRATDMAAAPKSVDGVALLHTDDALTVRQRMLGNLIEAPELGTAARFVAHRLEAIRAALDMLSASTLTASRDVFELLRQLLDDIVLGDAAAPAAVDVALAALMLVADRRLQHDAEAAESARLAGNLALALACHACLPSERKPGGCGPLVVEAVHAVLADRTDALVSCVRTATAQLGGARGDNEREHRLCAGIYEILTHRPLCGALEAHAGLITQLAQAAQACTATAAVNLLAHLRITFGKAAW